MNQSAEFDSGELRKATKKTKFNVNLTIRQNQNLLSRNNAYSIQIEKPIWFSEKCKIVFCDLTTRPPHES